MFSYLIEIADHVVKFYCSLYNSPFTLSRIEDVCGVTMVSENENSTISCLTSVDEIRNALFFMDHSSAPKPNGFFGSFYHLCWDIVQLANIVFVQDFFKQMVISKC